MKQRLILLITILALAFAATGQARAHPASDPKLKVSPNRSDRGLWESGPSPNSDRSLQSASLNVRSDVAQHAAGKTATESPRLDQYALIS
jgi:hypothetical protein